MITTGVTAVTTLVVTVNVALVAPAATWTLAGVVDDALLSANVTVLWAAVPMAGAFKVTVPVEEPPPMRAAGFIVTAVTMTGFTVRAAVCGDPFKVPVIVTGVGAETKVLVTVKVAVVAPAATATFAGTVAAALFDDNVTVLCAAVPAAGAFKVTVPVEVAPEITLKGLRVTDETSTGLIVNPAV